MAKSTVAIRFVGDVRDLKRSLDQVDGGFNKMSKAAKIGLAAAGAAVVAFAGQSVKAYAEAEKAQASLDAAFEKFPQLAGENADALRELNTELAKKTAFDDDATASAQALLAQFGLTEDQLRDITPLVQDYAAKTGKDLTTAATDVGKAMLGQGRALKTVGIDFQDTGDKAANFDQIVAGLDQQVGGFAETMGDTAAGKAQILSNQFGELQEKVGSALVPALSKLADVGLGVLDFIENMNGPTKVAIGVLAGLAASAIAVHKAMKAWTAFKASSTVVSKGIESIASSMGGLTSAAGLVPLAAVGAGLAAWQIESRKAQYDIKDLTSALTDMTDAGQEQSEAFVKALAVTDDLDRAVEEVAQTNVKAAERMVDLAEKTGLPAKEIEELREIIERKRESDVGGAQDQAAYTAEVQEAAGATDGLTGALEEEEAALQGVLDATLAQFDSNLQYRQSVDGVEGALSALKTTRQEEGAQSEAYRDQMLETEGAILRQADAAVKMAEDTAAGFGVTLEAKDKQRIYREELVKVRDTTAPGSPLRKAIDGYIARLDATPSKKATEMVLNTKNADAALSAYVRRLLGASLIQVGVPAGIASGQKAPARAKGGPVKAGEPYTVGEDGRELFVPNQNGTIVPNGTNGRTPVTTGGVNLYVNISVPPTMDAGAAGQSITEALAAYVRRNGANDLRRLLGV